MSQKVSEMLIKMLNEVTTMETTASKIDAAIFVRKSSKLIEEKISYLYNLIGLEAKSYNQNIDKYFEKIENIVKIYREKLQVVYDEIYLQYVNIQNEISEARLNQKVSIINYQKVINDEETKTIPNQSLKDKIKNKNDIYSQIIEKCNKQLEICSSNLEKQIDSKFAVANTLQVINENNLFIKIKNIILNLFSGTKMYLKVLSEYEKNVRNIDTESIIKGLRNETVEFVTDILEIKDTYLDEAV